MLPDERRKARKKRRRIRWNTLRIFSSRERRRWSRIVRRSRKVNVGQAPRTEDPARSSRFNWSVLAGGGPFLLRAAFQHACYKSRADGWVYHDWQYRTTAGYCRVDGRQTDAMRRQRKEIVQLVLGAVVVVTVALLFLLLIMIIG